MTTPSGFQVLRSRRSRRTTAPTFFLTSNSVYVTLVTWHLNVERYGMPVTIHDIARLASKSSATVSLVLSGKDAGRVSEKERERILQLAQRLEYRPNLGARMLREKRTYRLALLVQGDLAARPIFEYYYDYQRLTKFSAGMHKAGYSAVLLDIDVNRPAHVISRELLAQDIDGFVFLVWEVPILRDLMFACKHAGVPAVASGSTLNDESLTWTDIDRHATYVGATNRLIDEGHRNIVLLDITFGWHTPPKREAFLSVMKRRLGIDARRQVFKKEGLSRMPSIGEVIELTDAALDRKPQPDALLLTDVRNYGAVLHALRQRGLMPGKDCRVIGFGDLSMAHAFHPSLTHYALSIEEQVEFGLAALLGEIANPDEYKPRHKTFVGRFVEGET